MAIPHWTWPDASSDTAAELEATTGAFDALSDATRTAILAALFDADRPLAYSDLADAAGVEDNGRLNYHLRRLDDLLVRSSDGYALSAAGRGLVESVLAADALHAD